MSQEEKELLLKDLCARLPFRVSVKWKTAKNPAFIKNIDGEKLIIYREYSDDIYAWECCIEDIKPYLRPMSSMTEEEKQIMDNLWENNNKLVFADSGKVRRYRFYDISVVDFLNSRHFDYRGLIEKGLALEAPDGMYNTK